MIQTRIDLLVSIQGIILLVFYSEEQQAWQFRIVSGSAVFGERKIYYCASAAQKAGREWIETGR
jgi:hypothetical protein